MYHDDLKEETGGVNRVTKERSYLKCCTDLTHLQIVSPWRIHKDSRKTHRADEFVITVNSDNSEVGGKSEVWKDK